VKTVTSPEFRRILPRTASYAWLPPFRWSFLACLVILLGLSGALPVSGSSPPPQNKPEKPYALIFGTVWGPDDHPVYGVKVKIRRDRDKRASWELYSNHSGEFAQRVPAGKEDYVIWADLKGSRAQVAPSCKPGIRSKFMLKMMSAWIPESI
jgi:hypothetical protein